MSRPKPKICTVKWCRKQAAQYRTQCHRCRKRAYAQKNPYKYHYNLLKQNAKRRSIKFHLTFIQFKSFWQAHPREWRAKARPNTVCTWEMDRIDGTKGYSLDNIQLLNKRKNVLKWIDSQNKFHIVVSYRPVTQPDNSKIPF